MIRRVYMSPAGRTGVVPSFYNKRQDLEKNHFLKQLYGLGKKEEEMGSTTIRRFSHSLEIMENVRNRFLVFSSSKVKYEFQIVDPKYFWYFMNCFRFI
jgi:hypothetical protein